MAVAADIEYHPWTIDKTVADNFFQVLRDTIQWEEGIRSRYGPTRKAKSLAPGMNTLVDSIITSVLTELGFKCIAMLGIYLNYYRDGQDYTPRHRHPGTRQLVISLGATRRLTVESTNYNLNSGDVIVFGSQLHGVPKDASCHQGRISIAIFVI